MHTHRQKALAVPSIKLSGVAVDSGGRFTTPAVMKLNQSLPEYDARLLPHSTSKSLAQDCDETVDNHMSQTRVVNFFIYLFSQRCRDRKTSKTAFGWFYCRGLSSTEIKNVLLLLLAHREVGHQVFLPCLRLLPLCTLTRVTSGYFRFQRFHRWSYVGSFSHQVKKCKQFHRWINCLSYWATRQRINRHASSNVLRTSSALS